MVTCLILTIGDSNHRVSMTVLADCGNYVMLSIANDNHCLNEYLTPCSEALNCLTMTHFKDHRDDCLSFNSFSPFINVVIVLIRHQNCKNVSKNQCIFR